MEFQCPERIVLAIEHPGHVISVDNAVQSLGGPEALRRVADDPTGQTLDLRFRREDRFEHPIASRTTKTSNILIKVRTQAGDDGRRIVSHEPVAMIKHTVRFKGIADYQWNTSKSTFLNRLANISDTRDANVMSSFLLGRETDFDPLDLDLPPPPVFSTVVVPQTYNYHQNPAAKKVKTETGYKLVNRTRGVRQNLLTITLDDELVPQQPSSKLPSKPAEDLVPVIDLLKELFAARPMWTRRGIINHLNEKNISYNQMRYSIPYVAYMWRAGPWRDCYAAFGVDPRTDQSFSQYQAIYCTMKGFGPEWENNAELRDSNPTHLFDGQTLWPKGRTYMFKDMIDPILQQIQNSAVKRSTLHPIDGWWRSRTVQAVRTIMRAKLASLCTGTIPSDVEFSSILEHVNDPDEENVEIEDAEENLRAEAEVDERDGEEAIAEDDSDNQEDADHEDSELMIPIDPALTGDLDERVKTLMSNLMRPGHEFDNGIEAVRNEPSDYEDEGIYGDESE